MSLLSNAKWVSLSQFGRIIIQLISLTVLTRFIPPADYGLMALGTVVMNFVFIIRDLGTASAIIQRKEVDDDILNSVFWLNVTMGVGLCILIILCTPLIELLFKNEKLDNILYLLCFCFPLASIGSAHQALMERNSHFKKIAIIELLSSLSGFVVALLVAINNGGVYALVYQLICSSFISSILFFYLSSWTPSLHFKFEGVKKIIGFSSRLTVFNLVNYFSRNADAMIISRKYDANILGAYSLAYRIMLFPLQSLTFIALRSLYPILSRNQDDLKLIREIYLKTIFIISMITIPLMLGLVFLRTPFITIALGPNWAITSNILLWLAPTGIIQSILSCSGSILMSTNNTKTLMLLGIFGAAIQVLSFFIGSLFSINIFVFAYFIANVINALVVLYFTFKSIKLNIYSFCKILLIPTLSCSVMIIALHFVKKIIYINNVVNDVSYLIIQVIIGCIVYFIVFYIFVNICLRFKIMSENMIPDFLLRIKFFSHKRFLN